MMTRTPPTASKWARAPGRGRAARLHGDGAAREIRRDRSRSGSAGSGAAQGFENLEKLPQRVEVMDADAGRVKAYIAAHA